MKTRCGWCGSDALYIAYHDNEWGVPVHDDQRLFEFLILEGAQAGLSWLTILKKRENYRKAFDHFDCEQIARYSSRELDQLLANPGIVRNRLKIAYSVSIRPPIPFQSGRVFRLKAATDSGVIRPPH